MQKFGLFRALRRRAVLAVLLPLGLAPVTPAAQGAPAERMQSAPARLVILPFQNLSRRSEDAWLSESFSENLTQALTRAQQIQQIERTRLQAVLQEQSFTQSALVDPDSAPELGKLLGAQQVLLGNFQKVGETLVVNTRVVEVATGQILPGLATQVRGPASDLLGLQEQLSQQMLRILSQVADLAVQAPTRSAPAFELFQRARSRALGESPAELQAALNLVMRALQADSTYPAAWGLQAELQARLAQDEMQPEQRDSLLTQAVNNANRALALGAAPEQVYPALAHAWLARGERERGLEALRQILRRDPDHPGALLTWLRYSPARPEAQLQELKQLGLDLQNPWVALALGTLYLKQAQRALEPETAVALRWLRQAQSQLPDFPLVHLRLAEVFVRQQNFAEAQRELETALVRDPGERLSRGAIYFKMGEIEAEAGRLEQALKYYLQATGEERDTQAWAWLKISRIYALRRQSAEALQAFQNHLRSSGYRSESVRDRDRASLALLEQSRLDPGNPLFLNEMGRYALQDGDYAVADSYFERALQSAPGIASVRYNLALSRFYQRRWSEAAEALEQVLQLSPEHDKARYMLGLTRLRQGRRSEARRIWAELLERTPDHAEARQALEQDP